MNIQNGITLYDTSRQHGNPGLLVEVTGYHKKRGGIFNCPGGLNNYRIMMFHNAMNIELGDRKKVAVVPHTVTVFDSSQPSKYGYEPGEWDHSWVRVTGNKFKYLLKETGIRIGQLYPIGKPDEFEYWLRQIGREAGNFRPNGMILENLLLAFLHMLHASAHKAKKMDEGILKVCRYLDSNCTKKNSLDELAEIACFSKSHFCALFKEQTGYSPITYAAERRMQLAAQMLEDLNITISQVALACGFYDVYHFSKTFSKFFGKSPSEYRKGT